MLLYRWQHCHLVLQNAESITYFGFLCGIFSKDRNNISICTQLADTHFNKKNYQNVHHLFKAS